MHSIVSEHECIGCVCANAHRYEKCNEVQSDAQIYIKLIAQLVNNTKTRSPYTSCMFNSACKFAKRMLKLNICFIFCFYCFVFHRFVIWFVWKLHINSKQITHFTECDKQSIPENLPAILGMRSIHKYFPFNYILTHTNCLQWDLLIWRLFYSFVKFTWKKRVQNRDFMLLTSEFI